MSNIQMKDSEIDWIGKIPAHWDVKRLKDFLSISTGQTPDRKKEDNFTTDSLIGTLWIKPEDLNNRYISSSTEYITSKGLQSIKTYKPNSIIFSGIGDVGKIGICTQNFTTNQQNHILYNIKNNYIFVYYSLIAAKKDIKNYSTGNVVEILNANRLGYTKLAIPTVIEQQKIVNYLDHYTSKIDSEISYLEKKSVLLEEYKQSLIFETVTKGLDKNIPMKDSGIEWIGEIPVHWEIKRVSDYFKSTKSITTSGRTDVLSLTLNGVIEKDLAKNKGLSPESYDTYQIFKKNDLVFKLIDLANYQTSRVGLLEKNGIMSSAYIRLSNKKTISYKFSYYQFFDLYLRRVFNQLGGNGVRSTISKTDLLKIPFIYTNMQEQQNISNYLDRETLKIDTQHKLMKKKIALLKEYKQSLIYEAVTGKIEIPQEFYEIK